MNSILLISFGSKPNKEFPNVVVTVATYTLQGEITIAGSFDGGISYRNHTHPEGVELGSLGGFSAAFQPQMDQFVAAIVRGEEGGRESGEAALRDLMVAQAVYKSVNTKQWEQVALENLL